jgi:hypothetical protein
MEFFIYIYIYILYKSDIVEVQVTPNQQENKNFSIGRGMRKINQV